MWRTSRGVFVRRVPSAPVTSAPDAVIIIDVHEERLGARRITSSKDLLAVAVIDGECVLALHALQRRAHDATNGAWH